MVRYATRSWLLQERVPLSFIQARIYLHKEKPETLEEIAEKFGLPIDKVMEAESFIKKKVEDAEKERETSSLATRPSIRIDVESPFHNYFPMQIINYDLVPSECNLLCRKLLSRSGLKRWAVAHLVCPVNEKRSFCDTLFNENR